MVKIINHRLYLSSAPSAQDRGIRCYSKCLGAFLKCFKKAEKYVCEGKTYFVNSRSLKKYSAPALQPTLPSVKDLTADVVRKKDPLLHKLQYHLPEAIVKIKKMPLDRFKELIEQDSTLQTIAVYNHLSSLYQALGKEQKAELVQALLEKKLFHPFQKIAQVWTKEDALSSFYKCRSNPEHLDQLCRCDGKREVLIALLNVMTLSEFQIRCSKLYSDTMGLFLEQYENVPEGEAKALYYLKSIDSLQQISLVEPSDDGWVSGIRVSLGQLTPEVKKRWFQHLKADPKDFFKTRFRFSQQHHEFIKEYLVTTLAPDEVRAFVKLNPFNFTKDDLVGKHTLFPYLINQLDNLKAYYVVMGLWEMKGIDDEFRVKSLAAIYDTLKDKDKPWIYSLKLQRCLEATLNCFEKINQWEHFISNTIIDFLDNGGPNDQAFKALLSMAVIFGIKYPYRRPLLDTLLHRRICWTSEYQIFSQESENSPLFIELSAKQRKELENLVAPKIEEDQLKELVEGNFSEAIDVMKRMSLERFKQSLEKGEWLKNLGNNRGEERAKHLYLLLSDKKREALLHVLLQDSYYIHAIGKITEVWTKEEALNAYEKYQKNKEQLSWLCWYEGKKEPLVALLNIMTADDFWFTSQRLKRTQAIKDFLLGCESPNVNEGQTKAFLFLGLSPYGTYQITETLKVKWMKHIKENPNQFQYCLEDTNDCFAFVYALLNSMTPDEVKAFVKATPVWFTGKTLFEYKLITFLNSKLDEDRASKITEALSEENLT